jgi:hypothetical protein
VETAIMSNDDTTGANKKTLCVFGEICARHGYLHGAEAEELREGIEALIAGEDDVTTGELRRLVERVDARDSVAYLEVRRREARK